MRNSPCSKRTGRNPAPAAAFTRLELLVVVATGAVLVTLALAGTGPAGFDARRLLCLENLRRLAAASILYATDNQDHLPHPSWGTIYGDAGAGPPNWCYATYIAGLGWIPNAGMKMTSETQLPFLRAGQLWPYVREEAVFRCPEDVAELIGAKAAWWRSRNHKLTSFTMNGAVIDYGNLRGSITTFPGRAGATQPLSRFAPGAWLFWEKDESNPFMFNDAGAQPHEGISSRHGRVQPALRGAVNSADGSHIGQFDGSARFLSTKEYYDEAGGMVGGSQYRPQVLPNRAWCAPDSPEGGFF
jgi:hypothetical protein